MPGISVEVDGSLFLGGKLDSFFHSLGGSCFMGKA